jgi:hypothetical protein
VVIDHFVSPAIQMYMPPGSLCGRASRQIFSNLFDFLLPVHDTGALLNSREASMHDRPHTATRRTVDPWFPNFAVAAVLPSRHGKAIFFMILPLQSSPHRPRERNHNAHHVQG